MKRRKLEELRIAAAWEASPPCAPWRQILPVFQDTTEHVLWPVSIQADMVSGYEEPVESLEIAIEEGRALRVEERPRARRGHALVRRADGTFAVVPADEVVRCRIAETGARLGRALDLLEKNAAVEEVEDAFDGAYLVQPLDPVATTLRAGAAVRLHNADPEWFSQCIDDLAQAVEIGGDLLMVRNRPPWQQLPSEPLREALFRSAREALDEYLRPGPDLEPPVDWGTQCAAVATALFRRMYRKTTDVVLPHCQLAAVLAGDPAAITDARPILEQDPRWRDIFARAESVFRLGGEGALIPEDLEGTATAHARITDLTRFARTLHQLEQIEEVPARSGLWREFVQRMQGLDRWNENRPWREGELAAAELRSRLGLDGYPIHEMRMLAANNGIFVAIAALSGAEVDAAATQPRNVPPCVFVNERVLGERHLLARFAIAHELCHLLVDRSRTSGNAWVCQTAARRSERAVVLDAERRANAFAAYLLAPREAVRALVPSLPALDSEEFTSVTLRVRSHFGLTATAAAEHLVNCHHEPDGSTGPGREKLSGAIRAKVEEAARDERVPGFDGDRALDAEKMGPGSTRVRRGRFAVLVRRWVRAGQLSSEDAATLLGIKDDELKAWIAQLE